MRDEQNHSIFQYGNRQPFVLNSILDYQIDGFFAYLLSFTLLGICITVRLVFPMFNTLGIFALIICPLMISAWYCGIRPAVVSVILASVLVFYLFCEPRYHFYAENITVGFIFVQTAINLLMVTLITTGKSYFHESNVRWEESDFVAKNVIAVIESLPQIFFTCRSDGSCDYVNERWLQYTGLNSIEPDVIRTISYVVHQDDRERISDYYTDAVNSGSVFQQEMRICGSNGEYRWFICRMVPVYKNNHICRWIGTITDIHDVKKLSLDLKNAEAELVVKVNGMQREAQNKDEFIAMLGHELRNPLAPIINTLRLLETCDSEEKLKSCRQVIERGVVQIRRLIDDMLDITRLKLGRLSLRRETVDFREVILQSINSVMPAINSRHHTLVQEITPNPCMIYADAARIEQVTVNVLQNAVKYTDNFGKIEVILAVEGKKAVLKVRDNGVGLSADLRPKLFHTYEQSEQTVNRSQGGLGIGLALSKKIMEVHGGTVEAYSEGPGKGSEFSIIIPLSTGLTDTSIDIALPPIPEAEQKFVDVMVVDDNVDAADSLASVIQNEGHQVRIVYDGQAAIDEAERKPPDIMFLDIGLPKLDGYQVAKILKKKFNIRLIAVTGYGSEEDRCHSAKAGFAYHLTKPVDPKDIIPLLAIEKPT